MEYMQNQMDNLITASIHQYEVFYDKWCLDIEEFINENSYTWTVEDIFEQYRKYHKGEYISYTAKRTVERFKEDLEKLTAI